MTQEFVLKRAYDPAESADGMRVLIDRLWPRGLTKERAAIDLWAKDVAPSSELRTWWHGHIERFDEFAERYRAELDASDAVATLLADTAEQSRVTLVYGARDAHRNHALVLRDVLHAARA